MLSAAASSKIITPKHRTTLACNGSITKEYDDIDTNLEINAVRLQAGVQDIFLISIDTLFIGNTLLDDLMDSFSSDVDLTKDQIILNASHTHYAPFIDKSKPLLGSVDSNYYDYLLQSLKALIMQLLQSKLQAVTLHYADCDTENLLVNRRKKAWFFRRGFIPWKKCFIYPNEKAYVDSTLRLFHLRSLETNELLAVVWSFACHPVMYHSPTHVSGHFPADIRSRIRLDKDIPVLFLQGFSGDSRPKNYSSLNSFKNRILTRLNQQSPFQSFTPYTYEKWLNNLAIYFNRLSSSLEEVKQIDLSMKTYEMPVDEIWSGKSSVQTVTFSTLFLSDKLIILFVTAELMSYYNQLLQSSFPHLNIVPVGCVGDVFGYWPNKKMLKEGGYEVEGFVTLFSLKGKFKSCLENAFISAVTRLLK